jgi:energy-coupling factor transport system ATP-binding protein
LSAEYIRADQASYIYSENGFTLRPQSCCLYRDQVTFLMGPNGSGKSTFGKLMCGIIKPTTGCIRICGRDTREMSLGAIGRKVGYLWQKPQLQLFAPVVLEDMTFSEELKGAEPAVAEEKALYWLRQFDLLHTRDQMTHTLSGGEKQRLALAVVMMQGAEYLILDEPTKGLDDHRRSQLAILLAELRDAHGTGMLIISHDDDFCSALAERIIYIEEGEITDDRMC